MGPNVGGPGFPAWPTGPVGPEGPCGPVGPSGPVGPYGNVKLNNNSFGYHLPLVKGVHKVILEFPPNPGGHILNRFWHASQKMEKLENETTQMGEGLSMIQGLFLVRHGKLNVNIDREVVEHLDPVANWEVHDRSSRVSTCE